MASSGIPRFRVSLYDMGASRERGTLRAVIDDARDIGASEYVNRGGEFFMTLPWNHPLINEIVPLERHYRVARYNDRTLAYEDIFVGILDDFDANDKEVTVYGSDYLSLLNGSISGSNTSYTSATVGAIITDQLSSARGETNSRVAFVAVGSIDATTTTVPLALTSFQGRLDFISSVIDIHTANSSVRAQIVLNSRSSLAFQWDFHQNRGSDQNGVLLDYGGLVQGFRFVPGYADVATHIYGIGVKREGATILYSTQSYLSSATYGRIAVPKVYQDIVNQTALDKRAQRDARRAAQIGKKLSLSIRSNRLAPFDGYDLCDSLPVQISRGIVSINSLYTLWGLEWIGKRNGSEDLFLSLLPKEV